MIQFRAESQGQGVLFPELAPRRAPAARLRALDASTPEGRIWLRLVKRYGLARVARHYRRICRAIDKRTHRAA